MAIIGYINVAKLPNKFKTPERPQYGMQRDGYGRKIATSTMIQLPGSKRWRRVYCCVFGNSGTSYITANKGADWLVVR